LFFKFNLKRLFIQALFSIKLEKNSVIIITDIKERHTFNSILFNFKRINQRVQK